MTGKIRRDSRSLVVVSVLLVFAFLNNFGCGNSLQPQRLNRVATKASEPSQLSQIDFQQFCSVLDGLLDQVDSGFRGLRRAKTDSFEYVTDTVLPGAYICRVSHDHYECRFAEGTLEQRDRLLASLYELSSVIDHCLLNRMWWIRDWHKGRLSDYSTGNATLLYSDRSRYLNRTLVGLKVSRDYRGNYYYLELEVKNIR